LAGVAAPLLAQRRMPNIVLIISDDHHWQCFGAAGNPHIQTPNLDKLAQRGVLFSNGIVSTSQCAPSRGILLSGQESYQTGLDSNGHTAFRTFRAQRWWNNSGARYETNQQVAHHTPLAMWFQQHYGSVRLERGEPAARQGRSSQ
jgi:arylsulfatase A-like enzyme